MQHLLTYNKSQAANAVEAALSFVSDPAVSTDASGNPILPAQMRLLAAWCGGVNMTSARINSPYFRRLFLPYLYPLNNTDVIANDTNLVDLRDHSMTLPALEGVEVDTSNGAGANRHTVGMFIADGPPQQVSGSEVYTVKCTAAITCVAYTYVSGSIVFGQSLPQGQYGIVGALVQSATGIFARFLLPGQSWRPGVVVQAAVTNRPPFQGRKAPMGLMGIFQSTSLPQIEIFASAADVAQTIFLDLVKM